MTEALNELGAYIELKRPDSVLGWSVALGELTVDVTPSSIVVLVVFLFLQSFRTTIICTVAIVVATSWWPEPALSAL